MILCPLGKQISTNKLEFSNFLVIILLQAVAPQMVVILTLSCSVLKCNIRIQPNAIAKLTYQSHSDGEKEVNIYDFSE